MKKILVTGGAGFIGCNLSLYLAEHGYDITVFDNLSRNTQNSVLLKEKKIPLIRGELDDIADTLHQKRFDCIYHFAAQVAVTTSYESPRSDFRVNAQGTFNLVRAARDTPIIYASTNKVYGDNVNSIPVKEKETRYDFCKPYEKKGISEGFSIDAKNHTPYGVSKLVGDLLVREAGGIANRFSCIYGPNQYGNVDQGWLAHFVISQATNRPFTIYGTGKQVRDVLFIDDLTQLLEMQGLQSEKLRGEVFNVGGGYENTISLIELCKKLKIEPKKGDERPADQRVYYCDLTKVRKTLLWSPKTSVEQGLEKLITWVTENRHKF